MILHLEKYTITSFLECSKIVFENPYPQVVNHQFYMEHKHIEHKHIEHTHIERKHIEHTHRAQTYRA